MDEIGIDAASQPTSVHGFDHVRGCGKAKTDCQGAVWGYASQLHQLFRKRISYS